MEEISCKAPNLSASPLVRFGPYELDLRSAELRKHDVKIRLQEQPFRILVALLERPGEVVLREEIRARLWPDDTVVEFDHSISAAVKRLRDVLLESAEKPRYIETVARRGYRFIGRVETSPPETTIHQLEARSIVEPAKPAAGWPPRLRIMLLIASFFLLALLTAWYRHFSAPVRWARQAALPEAIRLATAGRYPAAFAFLLRARQVIPDDLELNRILREISHPASIRSTPPGAAVYVKAYDDPEGEWLPVGQTPMENFLLPLGFYRWKVVKPGFRTVESGAGFQSLTIEFTLDRENSLPPDMVHVPPHDAFQLFSLHPVHLDAYWMDKYEVTNRQYKEFVESGGYLKRQFWHERFIKDAHELTWEEAINEFRDPTGRPGPSTWQAGTYPEKQADFPVSGVSWYEAAAYAEFAHKQIPTVYHWFRAANLGIWSDILPFSNFDRNGPERVGIRRGLGTFGTFDMAGNVREWCWNATGNRRYILGGAWNDERFVYSNMNADVPFDRSAANGFRCVKYSVNALPDALTAPAANPARDRRT